MNSTSKRFRVALSFPGAKRAYVEQVAKALAERFTESRVLYDRFHTAEFADADLAFNLPDLYRQQSDLIVAVLCGEYGDRQWCGLEWRAIYSHIKEGNSKQVMIFRADDAEIRGLYGLEGFVPVDAFTPDEAVKLILQRLAVNEGQPRDFYLDGGSTTARSADFEMAISRLPKKHDSGVFEGRDDVLADLDALWADVLADKPGRAQIVSLVGIGGSGKSTVMSRWKDALLASEEHGGVERYFDWSFYSQGTRGTDGSETARAAGDATVFVAAALKFFGDAELADSSAPAWDKGARLAALVARHRTLLILDGLEPLQHPPGPQAGELQDDALKALFAGLTHFGRGLCLITTRERIADLIATEVSSVPSAPVVGRSPDRPTFPTAGLHKHSAGRPAVTTVGGSGDPPTTNRDPPTTQELPGEPASAGLPVTDSSAAAGGQATEVRMRSPAEAGSESTGQASDHRLKPVANRSRLKPTERRRGGVTPCWLLDHLTDAAGAAVLRGHGVIGPAEELRAASREVKGHALTLALMGRFLKLAFDPPDIARRDCFRFAEADRETSEVQAGRGHAFRVFAAYEQWLEREGRAVEVAILRLLGLFDRPATPGCLAALCAEPLPGLNDPLVGLGEKQWNAALKRLRDLDLIETSDWTPIKVSGYGENDARAVWEAGQRGKAKDIGPPQPFENRQSTIGNRKSLDAHPLLREYFAAQLVERSLAQAAQSRLYEHLCASVPYWPEGRDGLLPLYQAVAHGCQAGRFEESRVGVYRDRILRGTAGSHAHYSSKKLGLLGLDLAAVACFFVEPWSRLAAELTPADQAWLLSEAAFSLRALNRLAEAREPMRAGMELAKEQEDWHNAAIRASTLSELELTLGDIPAAEATAAQSVTFADRSGDAFERMCDRTTHADALHQAGRLEASGILFAEAEALQADWQPDYPLLYSLRGYQYCDLLLATAERAAWRALECGDSSPLFLFADPAPDSQPFDSTTPSQTESGDKSPHSKDLAAIENRATKTLEWAKKVFHFGLLDIALDHLTLGRVHLLRAVLESPAAHLPRARTALDTALATLRQSNDNDILPAALLPSAWLHALAGEWELAVQRLDEAFALATRGGNEQNAWQGGMRLHLVDTLLYRARLFGSQISDRKSQIPYPWAGRTAVMDLDEAATLIDVCGYHRRDLELADAREAAKRW